MVFKCVDMAVAVVDMAVPGVDMAHEDVTGFNMTGECVDCFRCGFRLICSSFSDTCVEDRAGCVEDRAG